MPKTKGALFVCLGNICRSPIAEAVFQHLIKDRGISDQWRVDSAGLGGWHTGNLADSRARATLAQHNIQYDNRARQIDPQDFHDFDYIFGMDNNNISSLKREAPNNSKAKILLLGSFDPEGVGNPGRY
ncbi:low molecular weight phosphotyrosine protein phosphatase 1-like [Asbolus verrucosus]|uniref:Low molecular weight phosphotyrosine protein phosphatase n=1 Tax=Asbolus verrucosus TaxID=1661398 RepID=A0A482VI84_ASBVE|nr:low molecular weight phosphotyrosine protein phosphatase 1-like [Asbolus verrucosus]